MMRDFFRVFEPGVPTIRRCAAEDGRHDRAILPRPLKGCIARRDVSIYGAAAGIDSDLIQMVSRSV